MVIKIIFRVLKYFSKKNYFDEFFTNLIKLRKLLMVDVKIFSIIYNYFDLFLYLKTFFNNLK